MSPGLIIYFLLALPLTTSLLLDDMVVVVLVGVEVVFCQGGLSGGDSHR